jgi:predicted nuclease of predicted toxin-antitoxin system
MPNQPRFHLDENVSHAVARALRQFNIDVTTTVDAGLRQANDPTQLAYARREKRVLVTHDADFLRLHANGEAHFGIAYCHKGSRTVGQMVEYLRLMYELVTIEELKNSIEYL